MQKGLFATAISIMGFLCACSLAFIVMYVVIVGLTIPQLPGWAQHGVEEWMLDIPQFSEHIEDDSYIDNAPGGTQQDQNGGQNGNDGVNGGGDGNTSPALVGPVPWSNYFGPYFEEVKFALRDSRFPVAVTCGRKEPGILDFSSAPGVYDVPCRGGAPAELSPVADLSDKALGSLLVMARLTALIQMKSRVPV
jgi:hypothetical protein